MIQGERRDLSDSSARFLQALEKHISIEHIKNCS